MAIVGHSVTNMGTPLAASCLIYRVESTMRSLRRVAVLLDTSRGWDAGLMRGVAKYTNLHNPWQFLRVALTSYQSLGGLKLTGRTDQSLRVLLKHRIEGVLMHESPLSEKLRQRGVATVIIPVGPLDPKSAYVTTDNEGAGRIAAEHLMSLGVRRFAYAGFAHALWSAVRGDAFRRKLEERGYDLEEHVVPLHPKDADKQDVQRRFARWLDGLPKPCGLFAGNDDLARSVIELCHLRDIQVPEQLAVIGADNDELICDLTSPPLTSIPFALENAGYEAAEMLDHAMDGMKLDDNVAEAAAQPVVVRRSTDYVAIDDLEIAKALKFIREHAGSMIQVSDVVRATTLSRRTLHNRFTKAVGHSIGKEIHRRRAEFIAGLLIETTQSIGQIAWKLGYPSDAHLVRFFRREYGETPGAYRRRLA